MLQLLKMIPYQLHLWQKLSVITKPDFMISVLKIYLNIDKYMRIWSAEAL